jgi:hypothetical protein
MDNSSIFTIIGLSFDIIGVLLLLKFHLGDGKVPEQTPVEKYKKYSKFSVGLIVVGFGLQIFAQTIN